MANASFSGWVKFSLAQDYIHQPAGSDHFQLYPYDQTRVERCGRTLRWGVGSALDFFLREIKNPIMIVSLTALASLSVTIAFYPTVAMNLVVKVVPFAAAIKPWMVKMALYILAQTTVLGLGLRAYGRFQNQPLVDAYARGEIRPVFIGTQYPKQ